MYYKVLKDNKVIDVLDHLTFVKYQKKHDIMIVCPRSEAQAIVSSDGKYFWHVKGLYKAPDCYDIVSLEEIDKYEYENLKILNLKSSSEIIDEFVLSMINNKII